MIPKMETRLESFLVGTILLSICLKAARAGQACDGTTIAGTVVVDQSGKGDYRTVQGAIDDGVPGFNTRWFKIHIKEGTYREKVEIPFNKPCVFLEGEGAGVTKITYDSHERTDTSATFNSLPEYVAARGITFENSYNLGAEIRAELERRNTTDLGTLQSGSDIKQAVAARIYGDKSMFYECSFLGVQDTLWDVQGRHFFKNCYIEGAVDFIFGNGQSVYDGCQINSIAGSLSARAGPGFITAQGRSSSSEPGGFVFRGGQVTGTGSAYLGRAYGPYSRVILYDTTLSSVVTPAGWDAWNFAGQEDKFLYAEVHCRGPGSDQSSRVSWSKEFDPRLLYQYSTSPFIDRDGWISKLPIQIQ